MVSLTSDQPARVRTPATVQIVAGAESAVFFVELVDDQAAGEHLAVALTAAAPDYLTGHCVLEVMDDDGWQNWRDRFDVDGDGHVVPLDLLRIINELNLPQYVDTEGRLPLSRPAAAYFYDVNGDLHGTPLDALALINRLNAVVAGEGESPGPAGGRFSQLVLRSTSPAGVRREGGAGVAPSAAEAADSGLAREVEALEDRALTAWPLAEAVSRPRVAGADDELEWLLELLAADPLRQGVVLELEE
jgi:hypothetical protein